MRIKRLIKHKDDQWKVCAPLDSQDRTEIETFLNGLDSNFNSNIGGIFALIQCYAKLGPSAMNVNICHLANAQEKIYEFIKGRIRVYWFDAGDKIIVCACACLKKTQKSDPKIVNQAIKIKKEYFKLKNEGVEIEIVEDEKKD